MPVAENYSSRSAGKAVLVIYATTIGVGGLLGNGLVIFLFIHFKYLRTVTNIFIINLAVCDLMIAILDMMFSIPTVYTSQWLFGTQLGTFYAFCHFYLVSVSMVMLAIIAVDRYYVICRSKLGTGISSRMSLVIIGGVYAYTFSVVSPILYASAVLEVKVYPSGCYVDFTSASDFGGGSYAVVIASFLYVAPLIVIVFYYWEIFKVLRKRQNRSSLAEAENNRRRYDLAQAELGNSYRTRYPKTQARTLRVMATLVGLFVVTWTPYMVVNLSRVFNQREYFNDFVQELSILLAKLVVVANPIVYALVNDRFQKCIAKLFCCTDVIIGGTTTENSLEFHGHTRGSRTYSRDPRSPRFSRQHDPRESSIAEASTPHTLLPLRCAYSDNHLMMQMHIGKAKPHLGERQASEDKRGLEDDREYGDQRRLEDKRESEDQKRPEDKRGLEDKRGSEEKRESKWNSRVNNFRRLRFDDSTVDKTEWYITVTTF